jgi:hypothetical protein
MASGVLQSAIGEAIRTVAVHQRGQKVRSPKVRAAKGFFVLGLGGE